MVLQRNVQIIFSLTLEKSKRITTDLTLPALSQKNNGAT